MLRFTALGTGASRKQVLLRVVYDVSGIIAMKTSISLVSTDYHTAVI